MGVLFLFLLTTSVGCLSTLFWIPEEDLGRGYFQLNALILLCLLALAVVLLLLLPLPPFGAAEPGALALYAALGAAFAYYACVWRRRWRAGRWAAAAGLLAALLALLAAGRQLVPAATSLPYRGPLLDAALLSSALLAGWALVTMLLGHWYLVSPRLTFRYLVIFCGVVVAAVLVRTASAGAGLAAAAAVEAAVEPHPWRLLTGFAGEGMFLWFRLLWGLAIPLALGLMSLQCARRRSNQSATGILYVLVVGAFIGEITALYLTLTTGVPI